MSIRCVCLPLLTVIHRKTLFRFAVIRQFLPFLVKLGPPHLRRFLVDLIPWKDLQRLKAMVDLIHNTSREVYEVKKAALTQGEEIVAKQVGDGKDMMTVLRKCLSLAF